MGSRSFELLGAGDGVAVADDGDAVGLSGYEADVVSVSEDA